MIEWFQAYSKYWPQISFFILMSNIELGQHGTQLRLALLFLIAGQADHASQTLPLSVCVSTTARVWEVINLKYREERDGFKCLSQPTDIIVQQPRTVKCPILQDLYKTLPSTQSCLTCLFESLTVIWVCDAPTNVVF